MDEIKAVRHMQDYIKEHFQEEDFTAEKVCRAAGYSRRHADRIFKHQTGRTLQEYVNAVCLTESANELAGTGNSVLQVALNSHFSSHEGFTRSFSRRFHVTPSEYREKLLPIPLFVQYPVNHYYALLKYKEETNMSKDLSLCMITAKERPQRKLIWLPSRSAEDYFSYCEEMGCEWEGLLNSIDEKFDTAALMELPNFLAEEGFSKMAAGIEVPLDFDKPLPAEYRTAELEPCVMLYFQTEPYEDEEDFCVAIESAYAAVGRYNPEVYGYRMAYDKAPSFNFGADTGMGAKLSVPAVKI
ncbi:helix-turn-helix transcriptional regulator [Faecalicatena contorta]|uniref:helix-turn-helix transcriptional regulator n=1 Tax=Faecalicatena contorta TaxID=39482 RepID=UPI00321656B7